MDGEKLKRRIGGNIAACRKRCGMTQAELAEKLSYSDKAVSKWERGESIPDVLTMAALAELFGVTVDSLLADPDALPEEATGLDEAMRAVAAKTLKRKADKGSILMLSSLLVWGVALLIYVVLSSIGLPNSWVAFFYAIPVNAIVLLSLRSAWRDFRWNRTLISFIIWGCILSLYITFRVFMRVSVWRLFLLGIPGQAAVWLWFRMLWVKKRNEEKLDG